MPCGARIGDASRIIGAWPRIARRRRRSSRGFAAPRCPPNRARARRGRRFSSCSTASAATSSRWPGLRRSSTRGCSSSASARRSSSTVLVRLVPRRVRLGRTADRPTRPGPAGSGPGPRRRGRGCARRGSERVFVAGSSPGRDHRAGPAAHVARADRRGDLHERPPPRRGPAPRRQPGPPPREARPDHSRDRRSNPADRLRPCRPRHSRAAGRARLSRVSTSGTRRARRGVRFVSDWIAERLER